MHCCAADCMISSCRPLVHAGAMDAEVAEYCKAEGIPYFSMYEEMGGSAYEDLAGEAAGCYAWQ